MLKMFIVSPLSARLKFLMIQKTIAQNLCKQRPGLVIELVGLIAK